MKRFFSGMILAGVLLAPAPVVQAQPPAIAEAQDARSWEPGVADRRGRVINPIFRTEKDRAAPVDRGIDPDTLPSSTGAAGARTAPPASQVVVTPAGREGGR